MNKKVNNNIEDLIIDFNDYEKLCLYKYLLRMRQSKHIYRVNYKAKRSESQAKTLKSRKFVRVLKIQ